MATVLCIHDGEEDITGKGLVSCPWYSDEGRPFRKWVLILGYWKCALEILRL